MLFLDVVQVRIKIGVEIVRRSIGNIINLDRKLMIFVFIAVVSLEVEHGIRDVVSIFIFEVGQVIVDGICRVR